MTFGASYAGAGFGEATPEGAGTPGAGLILQIVKDILLGDPAVFTGPCNAVELPDGYIFLFRYAFY